MQQQSPPTSARALFDHALELDSPAERDAFLAQACAEAPDLRRKVDALLQAYESAGTFLESPAPGLRPDVDLNASAEPREGPGAVIGPYKLLEQIGEGGFGVVFMAEQVRPVRRKVALKVVKPGMDTRQVVARFEAERQALALMDHEHIAKVLDAGATESGRPYFVMELVRGEPITEYCDAQRLTPRERLELFLPVCQAVQHAHTKGVIHRDLKPSNVLVTLHDGVPVPKVIDFGIAKATAGQHLLTERTLFTEFRQMVGTPLYMSPEQAEMSGLDVDTRSDVYSLGVLLYELLTGGTPFDKRRLKEAAYDEVRRIIREEEPPKPSTRVSTMDRAAASTLSERCRSDPRRLSQSFRGELDWIVLKAIEKDRDRRYQSAGALAADVRRYLNDEPVTACPPSASYRVRKWARRNKGSFVAAAAAAVLVVLAVVGLAVSNALVRGEQKRTGHAKDRAEQAQKLAEERAEQVRQEMEGLKAANAMLDRGRWYNFHRRWDDANAAFTKAIELRPDHVSLWAERGDLYANLGLWDLAAADSAHEVELREPEDSTRWVQHALLRRAVGDDEGCRRAARRMRERFGGTLHPMFALDMLRVNVLAPSADPGGETGATDPADLVERAEYLVARHPWRSFGLLVLGTAHYRAGRLEQAVRYLEEALAGDWEIRVLGYPTLAMARHRLDRPVEAREALDAAAAALDRWTAARYEDRSGERWIHNLGAEGAWPVPWWDWLELSLRYREARILIDGAPPVDDPRLHVLRARSLAALRWLQAAQEYEVALKLNPDDVRVRLEAHRARGYLHTHYGAWSRAASEFAAATELRPDDVRLWRFRAVAHFAAGDVAAHRQDCAAMLDRFGATREAGTASNVLHCCTLGPDALADPSRLLPLARVAEHDWHYGMWVYGAALYRAGRYAEALRVFESGEESFYPRAWDWAFRAMANHRLGRADEARRCLAEARRWMEQADRYDGDELTGTRPAWGDWPEQPTFRLLVREAEALIEGGGGGGGR